MAEHDADPVEVPGAPTYCAYTEYKGGRNPEDLPATGDGATGATSAVFEELYGVDVADGHATVTMTLTFTGCPARDYLQADVRRAAERADGVDSAEVELVWSPEWNLELVTEDGREALREFGVSL